MKNLIIMAFLVLISNIFADTVASSTQYAYVISRNTITTCKINQNDGNLYACNNKNGTYKDISSVSINKVIENGLNNKIINYFANITAKNQSLSCIINPYTGMISYLNCQPINLLRGINVSNNTFNKYNYQITSVNDISICTNDAHTCHDDKHFKDIQDIAIVSIAKPIEN